MGTCPFAQAIAHCAMWDFTIFYAALVKSVYTKVNKLTVPVGYNFNCTNIFLGISEPLAPSHCFMGKISVLRKQMGYVYHFYASGYVGGVARYRHCANKCNFFYAALVKSVYTKVNKLTVPVGYNFNCTNIFLEISEPLAVCHCCMVKILGKYWIWVNIRPVCAYFYAAGF